MAKNFFKQIFGLTGLKAPDANGYYDPSVYVDESRSVEASTRENDVQQNNTGAAQTTELTGVAKYLAKKQPAVPEGTAATTELTGVAKYLAQKQQEEQEKAAIEKAAQANMTGVAKYLAKLEAKNKTAPQKPLPAKKINTATLTGVDKYLAQKKQTAPVKQQAKVPEKAPKEPEPLTKPEVMAKKEKPVTEEQIEIQPIETTENIKQPEPAAEAPEKTATAATTTSSLINLSEDATQCQAATVKGTQCRRSSNLDTINKTINKQKYKFAVCSQHNNNDFTAFSELLQSD